MTIDPLAPPLAIAAAGVLLGAVVVVGLLRSTTGRRRWFVRLAMVGLLVVIALRPVIPGSDGGRAASGGLEVYFIVDTTASMVAEDGQLGGIGGGTAVADPAIPTRLDLVRADIAAIAAALPGAQFSLTTFDSVAVQRVPLTSDASALVSAADALTPEIGLYSQGSSIDVPLEFTTALLADAQATEPDRRRVLFYLGDGEQTRAQVPASFAPLGSYTGGGAVLGYGTDEGGRMREFDGYAADDDPSTVRYIQDPADGGDAVSTIDRTNLSAIASQLGVGYVDRSAGDTIETAVAGIEVGAIDERDEGPSAPIEFYWLAALLLAACAVAETIRAGLVLASVRPLRRTP